LARAAGCHERFDAFAKIDGAWLFALRLLYVD
jgi:hypothetical protein